MKEIPLEKCDPSSPILRMSVTKPCFTTQYQTCKTNTKTKSVFFVSDHITDIHTRIHGAIENAGVEYAGVENAGVDRRGGKCRSGKCRRPQRMESREESNVKKINKTNETYIVTRKSIFHSHIFSAPAHTHTCTHTDSQTHRRYSACGKMTESRGLLWFYPVLVSK